MKVLFIRHSLAVDPYDAPTDEMRWLTSEGRERMRAVSAALVEAGLRYDRVYTSPLVRAVQTAEILVQCHPNFDGPLEVHAPLAPDRGTTAQALSPLDDLDEGEAVVVFVGHEPKIRVLAGHLAGLGSMPGFHPGTVCMVELREGSGSFGWMMDPRTRRLASSPADVLP